ncbi:Hypp1795 [Branchiostoma lanceolatum]|uniref:Hypp1795 protein n=1 Tax=Branchiostoma lanceolatum TaxID=7740 RepID=A0A8J9ZMV9_BRALA|nr:Hypp1795 [Branchiostoma lanceolatum]
MFWRLLKYLWPLYLLACGSSFYSDLWETALDRQLMPRDPIARGLLDGLKVFDTTSDQLLAYPVANEEIFVRAYLRPGNETHYSRIVQCDLYKDVHRDTMVKRLTAGGRDTGRVNMPESWRFPYLVKSCLRLRFPSTEFDVPVEEAPPYHPITWLELARNIRDWTKDYLREALSEEPTDSYTGPGPRPLRWTDLLHDGYRSVMDKIFWSETPADDSTTEKAPEIDCAEDKAESDDTLTTSHTYFWPWTTSVDNDNEETPDTSLEEDSAEPGWSVLAWIDRIFQNPMTGQNSADPPVVLDDPP